MIYLYIAGSSTEIERAKAAAEMVAQHNRLYPHAQIHITNTWWTTIENRGDANPVDAPFHERMKYAADDLDGVQTCDMLWLLLPPVGTQSIGAYWEAGFADALRKEILISGTTHERSIFTTRGACFNEDQSAMDYLADCAFNSFDTAEKEPLEYYVGI